MTKRWTIIKETASILYNYGMKLMESLKVAMLLLVNWWYWCQPGSETTPLLPVSWPRWGRGRRRRTSENTASWKSYENFLNLNYNWKTFIFEMGGTPCCGCPLPTVMASTLAPKFLQSAHPSPPPLSILYPPSQPLSSSTSAPLPLAAKCSPQSASGQVQQECTRKRQ